MDRRNRTNQERSTTRAICPAPTLLALLLLVTVMPGAAAYAVLERDVALRTTLREVPNTDDSHELSSRMVEGLASAMARSVEAQGATLRDVDAVAPLERSFEPALAPVEAGDPVTGRVRLALLNLPPPLA